MVVKVSTPQPQLFVYIGWSLAPSPSCFRTTMFSPLPKLPVEVIRAIVTGDRDLLDLGQHLTVRMVTPRTFLDELDAL